MSADEDTPGPVSLERARAAQRRALAELSAVNPRAAVGLAREGEGYVLQVVLAGPVPAEMRLPDSIDGVPLRVKEVGAVRPR